jgi:hypothetical protein
MASRPSQASAAIMRGLSPDIQIMLGGHQAKAMSAEILNDTAIARIDALILGEAETRVARLLEDTGERECLPHVYWRENGGTGSGAGDNSWLFPDINGFVGRMAALYNGLKDGTARNAKNVAHYTGEFDIGLFQEPDQPAPLPGGDNR